ncbi:MAG: aminotransferase class III-fold pyridoxal phosphate-dependent enzyme, partial [Alphaproteobacteria bacterium]|nr:aminotransferase class III-fold pyridoxal phosphate-dependent enzyme [Alphaproteobacteria bacterium]
MSHVFPRNSRAEPPVATGGLGIYLFDAQGRRYIDASGGAAVSSLGHGHPRVVEALKRQAETLVYAHTSFFTSEAAEQLADMLIEHAPGGMERVYFVSGGSEAVETAIKMARQYFIESGQPSRRIFISRRQSYHGNTLGALSAGGNEWRREPYRPLLIDMPLISPCFAYRCKRDDESEDAYGQRVANELEAKVLELGSENVAGFFAETVVGATTGAVTAVPGYFRRIREICDRHGVLLIL